VSRAHCRGSRPRPVWSRHCPASAALSPASIFTAATKAIKASKYASVAEVSCVSCGVTVSAG